MIVLCLGITVVVCLIILCPFFIGKGGRLQAAASVNSKDLLKSEKEALIKRFVEDEALYLEKKMMAHNWQKRRQYLVNRYIDAAKRLDFLEYQDKKGE